LQKISISTNSKLTSGRTDSINSGCAVEQHHFSKQCRLTVQLSWSSLWEPSIKYIFLFRTTRNPETGSVMTYSNITLDSLNREDVHTKLTCQASNLETNILRTSVELDMKCKTILNQLKIVPEITLIEQTT
jgi:hypothetical protein